MTARDGGMHGDTSGSSFAVSGDPAPDCGAQAHQESIHVLNHNSGILGVVTLPAKSLPPEQTLPHNTQASELKPALILFNAGLWHRSDYVLVRWMRLQ